MISPPNAVNIAIHKLFAKTWVSVTACISLSFFMPLLGAQSTKDTSILPYVKPDRIARIDGHRSIHFRCMGTGSPTVILTAALGEWSETWRYVQPALAKRTRVCSWDRAGFGFSSDSNEEQNTRNTTSDLQAGLESAGLKPPYVLVGHSLGGYESLLFKDRASESVIGMVLVDPSIVDQADRFQEASPFFSAYLNNLNAARPAYLRKCASTVSSGKLRPGAADPDGCFQWPAYYPSELADALSQMDTELSRWNANISLSENAAADSRIVVNPARNYGAMPLIVLSAMKQPTFPSGTPRDVVEGRSLVVDTLVKAHDEVASLSSRGINRLVPDSEHYIQIERPAVVIAAVEEVLVEVRTSKRTKRR